MLIVHHLNVSQSERIVWLCEELGIEYELKHHKRDPLLAPHEMKALYPLGTAPVIQDGDVTIGESAACADYIIHKLGNGRLALPPSHKDYADYLTWFHFSNGTLQPTISRVLAFQLGGMDVNGEMMKRTLARQADVFKLVDDRLAGNTWLAGDEFTAADIMTVFSFSTMRYFASFDLSQYGNILSYMQRVAKREGYQRAMKKGDPGMALALDGPPPPNFIENLKK